MVAAVDALKRLQDGNRRFAENNFAGRDLEASRRQSLDGQNPFAVILGCSDSRVPVETIFDEGLGDLFVIRVAGNVAAPSQTGSVEFAVAEFGTRLVVVLGHTNCGAVKATLNELQHHQHSPSANLRSIIERISPAVQPLIQQTSATPLLDNAIRANIKATADHLRHESESIKSFIQREGLLVVGAEYSLETGLVNFFDGLPG